MDGPSSRCLGCLLHACDVSVNFGNIRRGKKDASEFCMSGAEDRVAGQRLFSVFHRFFLMTF